MGPGPRRSRHPPGGVPPYVRRDLAHGDPKDRPTNEAYDRFVYLAARYRDSGYDDARLVDVAPFLIAGPMFDGILVLVAVGPRGDRIRRRRGPDATPRGRRTEIHAAIIDELWDAATGRMSALEVTRGERSVEDTIVSFAPLLDPHLSTEVVDAIVRDLRSASFHPDRPDGYVVPSFDLKGEGFDERRYWRGPVWINTNWMLWLGLRQHGQMELAEEIAASSLRAGGASTGFHEYFDPFDGRGFGTDSFGWTAALTIDLIERLDDGERRRLTERLAASQS